MLTMTTDSDPVDVVMGADGCWHVLYGDGSTGPALTIDEMLDVLPHLREGGQKDQV